MKWLIFHFFFAVCLIGALLVRLCVCAFVPLCVCAFVFYCYIGDSHARPHGDTHARRRVGMYGTPPWKPHPHQPPRKKKNPKKTKSKLGKYQTETTRTERKFLCVLKKKKKKCNKPDATNKKGKNKQKKKKIEKEAARSGYQHQKRSGRLSGHLHFDGLVVSCSTRATQSGSTQRNGGWLRVRWCNGGAVRGGPKVVLQGVATATLLLLLLLVQYLWHT